MPELAQALTRAGMSTEASPALRERGAYVRLKERSPEAVRRLLGEALDVAFRPRGAGWTMVADPAAKERDRLLLIAYKRQAVETASAWAKEQIRLRGGRSYLGLRAWADAHAPETKALPADDPQIPKRVAEIFGTYLALRPSSWLGVAAARDSGLVSGAIEAPQSWTVSRDEAERTLGLSLVRLSPKPTDPILELRTSLGYDVERGVLSLGARAMAASGEVETGAPWAISAGGWGLSGSTFGETEVSLEAPTVQETFARMGPVAKATLDRFVPMDALPREPKAAGATSRSLSSLLERLDLEAAMELSPRFEEARTTAPLERFSLRTILDAAEEPPPFLYARAPDWLNALLPPDRYSRTYQTRAFPWRAVSREGLWIVADPLAFLDRLRPLSPVPYLVAERILRDLPKDAPRATWFSNDPLPDWRTVERIAYAVPRGSRLERNGYRGVASNLYGGLLPLVGFMDAQVPPIQRAALWKAATDPAGAKWETPTGVFTLKSARSGTDPGSPPIVRVEGRWQGKDGGVWVGEGFVDGRELGEP